MEPSKLFEIEYKGHRNFMTPEIYQFGWIKHGEIAFELSHGYGLFDKHMFGVTVVELVDAHNEITRSLHNISNYFSDINEDKARREAMIYIKRLKRKTVEELRG